MDIIFLNIEIQCNIYEWTFFIIFVYFQEPVLNVAESTTEQVVPKQEEVAPDSQTADDASRNGDSQKPVISEADSTETSKAAVVKEEVKLVNI